MVKSDERTPLVRVNQGLPTYQSQSLWQKLQELHRINHKIIDSFVVLLIGVFVALYFITIPSQSLDQAHKRLSLLKDGDNPCCAWPCMNQGDCLNNGTFTSKSLTSGYQCDCDEGWSGSNCQTPSNWGTYFPSLITANNLEYARNHFAPVWWIVNRVPFLARTVLKTIVHTLLREQIAPPRWSTVADYRTWQGLQDTTYYSRLLPPVPKDCPTSAGATGPKKQDMPDAHLVVDKLLARRDGKFTECPMQTSLLLAMYAQHFTHQFFRTPDDDSKNFGKTESHHYIDCSHLYGQDNVTQHRLRSHKGGKMRMKTVNGEDLPPLLSDLPEPVPMTYDRAKQRGITIPPEEQFALGHPFFGIFPGLTMLSTIWLREHNRVCELLAKDHPDWDDERLFQTARMINIVTTMRITVNDYVSTNLAAGHFRFFFDPALMRDAPRHQYQNRIALEFNHLYHWHPFLPELYQFGEDIYNEQQVVWNNSIIYKYGISKLIESFSVQQAGTPNGPNFGPVAQYVAAGVIDNGRKLRLQTLNRYREQVKLPAYTSFEEVSDDPEIVKNLKSLYKDPDAIEFFPGLFAEKRREGGLFGETISNRGVPSTFQGVFGHPLLSPKVWKPSTFGGRIGWQLANRADDSLQDLVCRNTKGKCPRAKLKVPTSNEDVKPTNPHNRKDAKNFYAKEKNIYGKK